jgi:uncharacterized protein (DUF58 family)
VPRPSDRPRRRFHPRALAVAATGIVALVASGGFGTPALLPLGIGLVVLGIGAVALVESAARGLRVSRDLDRDTLRQGERGSCTVRLRGWAVRNRLVGLLDWEIRPGLPAGCRIEPRRPIAAGGEIRQDVAFTGLARGEHRLDPPAVSLADPFGLARVRRAARPTDAILVLPRTVPVAVPFWESGAARRSGDRAGLLRGRSELGGVRDYESGDPLSLIHWGHTARRGRLQTKELHGETGRGAALLVILDARGGDANGAGPDAPFEIAVCAAASLVAACTLRGDQVGLDHTAAIPRSLPAGSPPGAIDRELALVRPDGAQALSLALRSALGRHGSPRTLVLVTADGDRGLPAAAGQACAAGCGVAAVLIGPARAYAPDLRRAGARVTEVAAEDDLTAALDGSVDHARVASG